MVLMVCPISRAVRLDTAGREEPMKQWKLGTRGLRVLFGAVLGATLVLALAPTAAQAAKHETVTITQHQHGTFPIAGKNPCTGVQVSGTQSINAVEHETYFVGEDELWATFTEEANVDLTDTNGVTYSGHLTVWGNFNVNEKNSNSTFTQSFRIKGSDGSLITGREVAHFTYNGNGDLTVQFDKVTFTCA
jgi:hypothetical protein